VSQRPVLSLHNSNSSLDLIQCCPPFDHSYDSARRSSRPVAKEEAVAVVADAAADGDAAVGVAKPRERLPRSTVMRR